MWHVTHREAVFGPVIHSIFDVWHYEVDRTCNLTRLLRYACNYGRLILYIMLHWIKLPNALHCTLPSTLWGRLPGILARMLPLALDGTQPACLTVHFETSAQEALKHTPEHAVNFTPNCTRWHTPSLLDCTLPRWLSRRSHVHRVCSQVHTRACSQRRTQLHSMAHSQRACLYTPKPALKKLSSTLPIALDGTLPAYLALRFQLQSQEGRHSQSHLTICAHVPYCMLDAETCWVAAARQREAPVAGARHREVWGRWSMVGSVWLAACGKWCGAGGGWHMGAESWRLLLS